MHSKSFGSTHQRVDNLKKNIAALLSVAIILNLLLIAIPIESDIQLELKILRNELSIYLSNKLLIS